MSKRFNELSSDEQIARLRNVIEVLASWLLYAQTGFGDQDVKGIHNLIEYGTVTVKVEDE